MARSSDARQDRLKAALKANMARRKAQAKDRGTAPNHHGRAKAPPAAPKGQETDDG